MQNPQTLLAGGALLILGALGGALVAHAVPADNREILSMIVGAIGGALTMTGVQKAASRSSADAGAPAGGETVP